MKKLMILFLVVTVVLGMSSVALAGLATATAETDVILSLPQSVAVKHVTHYFNSEEESPLGLFYHAIDGGPGLYVADGSLTEGVAKGLWSDAEPTVRKSKRDVDGFVVDTNTLIDITLQVDWTEWPLPTAIPTLFAVYSDEVLLRSNWGDPDPDAECINLLSTANGFGTWGDGPHALVTNDPNDGEDIPTFTLPFNKCTPYLLQVTGALYLSKYSQAPASSEEVEYKAKITMLVEAQ